MFQHQPTRTCSSTEHEATLNSPLPVQKTSPATSPIVPVSGPIRLHHHNINSSDGSATTRPMPSLWSPLTSQHYLLTDPLYSWCLPPNPIGVPTISTNTMFGAPPAPCMTDSRILNRLQDKGVGRSGMPPPYLNFNGNNFAYDFRLTRDDTFMTYSNTSF